MDWGEECSDDPESRARAHEVFDRFLEALGGTEAIDQVTGLEIEGESIRYAVASNQQGHFRLLILLPDHLKQEVGWRGQTIVTFLRPDGAFVAIPGAVLPLPPDRIELLHTQLSQNLVALVQSRNTSGFELAHCGDANLDGRQVTWLRVTRTDEPVLRLAIESGSGFVARLASSAAPFPDLGRGLLEITFWDYRAIGGLQLPFRSRAHFEGRRVLDSRIDSIRLSPDLSPADFALPDTESPDPDEKK